MLNGKLSSSTVLFSGNSNELLAHSIAQYLNIPIGTAEISQFSDGEIRVEIMEHVRGKTAFVIQSTSAPVNDNLMELLIIADALRRSDIKRIVAVIPYYGYSRQDRRPGYTRTPITSRLVADMIQNVGITHVITVDLHSEQQKGFFTIPVTNISAVPEIVADIWKSHHNTLQDVVIVSPDIGGVNRARSVAKQLEDVPIAIIDKRRPRANQSQVMNVVGDVREKYCIIIDDMIDTAGTLCKAAQVLKDKGATCVYAYATHPVFSGHAYDNIAASVLDDVVVFDTIALTDTNKPSIIRVISIASLLGETIQRMRTKSSVSQLYTGD